MFLIKITLTDLFPCFVKSTQTGLHPGLTWDFTLVVSVFKQQLGCWGEGFAGCPPEHSAEVAPSRVTGKPFITRKTMHPRGRGGSGSNVTEGILEIPGLACCLQESSSRTTLCIWAEAERLFHTPFSEHGDSSMTGQSPLPRAAAAPLTLLCSFRSL